jgi:hypothetical protein
VLMVVRSLPKVALKTDLVQMTRLLAPALW